MGYAFLETTSDVDVISLFYLEINHLLRFW